MEVQLLLHAVPKDTTPGKKFTNRQRQEDYKAAEKADKYDECLVFLYDILREEEKEEMVRRTVLNNRWDEISKKSGETWAAFKVKWDDLLMDLAEEGMDKDPASKYHRLVAAVNVKDEKGGESQGEKACKDALHRGVREYEPLLEALKKWFELEEALSQNSKKQGGSGGGGGGGGGTSVRLDRQEITCGWCGNTGHEEKKCLKKKRGAPKAAPKGKSKANPPQGPPAKAGGS